MPSILNEVGKLSLSFAKILFFCMVLFISLGVTPTQAASLSSKDARKLIARVAGFELKNDSVHVKRVSALDAATAEATVEIDMAFRFEQNDEAEWRVAEVRSGQDSWEDVALIFQATGVTPDATTCDQPDLSRPKTTDSEISVKRARCLMADLLGVELPSDAVRIKSVSAFGLPLGSRRSALVAARIEVAFRFTKDRGSWRVNGVRTGTRGWADPEAIESGVNREKAARARAELQSIAKALEVFRSKHGFYVETKSEAALIDFLSPVYLSPVIRLDPWHRPYHYDGARDHFNLRSTGPDGKANTGDDIALSGPAQTTAL